MKPEEINLAIAVWAGWQIIDSHHCVSPEGYLEHGNVHQNIPNYHFDLNEIHEAEASLKKKLGYANYVTQLSRVCCGGYPADITDLWHLSHATAPQRCEALLKTIGKWTEQ